jgi:hypothetical protein
MDFIAPAQGDVLVPPSTDVTLIVYDPALLPRK